MLLLRYMRTIVVAFDKKLGIGANNDLLWLRDLPADLKHFKEITTGHPIIMGRNTYESIGRPLPNRQNIVISSTLADTAGIDVVSSLDDAYELVHDKDAFVIGGARVYEEAITSADEIIATEVDATFEQATVFFPAIDPVIWQEVSREHHARDERNAYNFDFVRYTRR